MALMAGTATIGPRRTSRVPKTGTVARMVPKNPHRHRQPRRLRHSTRLKGRASGPPLSPVGARSVCSSTRTVRAAEERHRRVGLSRAGCRVLILELTALAGVAPSIVAQHPPAPVVL